MTLSHSAAHLLHASPHALHSARDFRILEYEGTLVFVQLVEVLFELVWRVVQVGQGGWDGVVRVEPYLHFLRRVTASCVHGRLVALT